MSHLDRKEIVGFVVYVELEIIIKPFIIYNEMDHEKHKQ
jgi:hypothetical protein